MSAPPPLFRSRYDAITLLRYFICSSRYRNLSIIYIINFIYIIIYIKYRNSNTPTCPRIQFTKRSSVIAKQRNSVLFTLQPITRMFNLKRKVMAGLYCMFIIVMAVGGMLNGLANTTNTNDN